jgi:diaminopimelate epimerase
MILQFYKYHGTGNDFILLDCRDKKIDLSKEQIAHLCHRHFGIGADGLMYLQQETGYDFRMVYFNADGGESTMCGNGGRCMVAFAHMLDIIKDKTTFIAIDGAHTAEINADGVVSLQMVDVNEVSFYANHAILNTGSPHYVSWVDDVEYTDVFTQGRAIRNREEFSPGGINVNFAKHTDGKLWVRTYERGVEDETLSCGTGVVASAIAATKNDTGDFNIGVKTPGGELQVQFTKDTQSAAKNVILKGPATYVYKGEINMN